MPQTVVAGGCFWGVQHFFSHLKGIVDSTVGYANSTVEAPSYEQVKTGQTGAVEAVSLTYDEAQISLSDIYDTLFLVCDPTTLNQQGGDVGTQYRTGIYYRTPEERKEAENAISRHQGEYNHKIAIEVSPLTSFHPAEEYHQDYLEKNPQGYCHVRMSNLKKIPHLLK